MFSAAIRATRGITAGSGFATTELRLLLIDVIDVLHRLPRAVSLIVYVDDMTIDCIGPPRLVADSVAAATRLVACHLEGRLGLELSSSKSVAVASTMNVSRQIAKAARRDGMRSSTIHGLLLHRRSTKLFGGEFGGGRRRSTKAQQARLKAMRSRIRWFHNLRAIRVRIGLMARVAAQLAVTYQADIVGFSDTALQTARSIIARFGSTATNGRCVDATLTTLDADGGATDAAVAAHALPIGMWALAVWHHSSVTEQPYRSAIVKLADCRVSPWAKVTGPAAATVASAWCIGWSMVSAHQFLDDRGVLFDWLLAAGCCWRLLALVRDPLCFFCVEKRLP